LTAVEKALLLLARKSRTEMELDSALERSRFSPEDRKSALARMRELGYIDDRELARQRARSLLERGKKPWFVARKLEAQGVPREEARAAAAEVAAELGVAWEGDDIIEDE
jgi:SOS response regulatory protein OraA/RecX